MGDKEGKEEERGPGSQNLPICLNKEKHKMSTTLDIIPPCLLQWAGIFPGAAVQ